MVLLILAGLFALILGKITITFGNLRYFGQSAAADRKEAYAEFSRTVMSDIFAIQEEQIAVRP